MATVGGFDRSKHLSELADPIVNGEGVISPTVRKRTCLQNLGVSFGGVPSFADATDNGGTTVAADVLAIPVTHTYVAKTTGADAEALTLANGSPGQIIVISLAVDGGGTGTLTPTTCSGFVSIAFADVGDSVALMYVNDVVGWVPLGVWGDDTAGPVLALS